jgi:uncharacterized membrane protein YeiH
VSSLLVAFDLAGTFVFALSGATAGVKHRLDLFGVLVLSFAAGSSGGIARDVMIGAVPPVAITDWRHIAVSVCAGLITFYWYPIINRLRSPVLVFDAAGLALFAVSGATKALAFHADGNFLSRVCQRTRIDEPSTCERQATLVRGRSSSWPAV